MKSHAWLVVILERNDPTASDDATGAHVVGVAVFSEPHPTMGGHRATAVLVDLEGESYAGAKRNCLDYAALHFPWLEVTE